jgi:hypothetical protein
MPSYVLAGEEGEGLDPSHLHIGDIIQLKEMLANGIHELSPEQINTVRNLVKLFEDYGVELQSVAERERRTLVYAKLRLQLWMTWRWLLGGLVFLLAGVQALDGGVGVLMKWWGK